MLAEFTGETLALASWTPSGGTLLLRCCEGVASGLFPWLSRASRLERPGPGAVEPPGWHNWYKPCIRDR